MPFSPGGANPVGPTGAVALAGASLVAAAAAGSIFLNTARDALTSIAAAGPAGPADGILLVAALGGVLLTLWLGLGMTLSALSALPGAVGHACRRLAGRIAPAAVRKMVAFILGTTLTAALVPGSAAAVTGRDAPRPGVVAADRPVTRVVRDVADVAPDASFRVVSNLVHDVGERDDADAAPPPTWSPESAVSRKTLSPRAVPPRAVPPRAAPPMAASPDVYASPAGGIVVVHRGDTLWSIAARHLGPTAAAADIATECHRWFATNRKVIGDDANLILPGQVLRPPSPQESS